MNVGCMAVVTKRGNHPLVVGAVVRIEEVFNDGVARVCILNTAVAHVPVDCLAPTTRKR